ncbi:MAG TPA: bifunctional phosphopantothenoylcysteine decarboxylase/phosphopantothenate--cysteine ligase CoaBC [Thermodesulfobacteriota bacterium]|nr:bifunctional phosphopantothenoylcysteine decarboxylase/phosphopantothenate--cysteine ligase CoaBC [Thermodesulfobacteriota bacterium]
MLKGKKIVLGVTGGIAAYKAAELVRELVRSGAEVFVVMTRSAQEFITPLTLQTLSGNKVATELFSLLEESEIGHISLADRADILVIAPATANMIGKIAGGIADDMLSTVVMATQAPVLLAPAMNVHMWENSITQENIQKLRARGYHFIDPEAGELACGYEGKGRLAEIPAIVEEVQTLLSPKDYSGETILVTAGPTEEPIDPVRFLSNRSSGKMGFAVSRAARRRGAQVTLVSGPTALTPPPHLRFIPVRTAAQMREAVLENLQAASIVVMAAAVSDFRPQGTREEKIKKSKANLNLLLELNPDILYEAGQKKGTRLLIGFAAETHDLLQNARQKLAEKNLDLIVANDVSLPGAGFAADTNIVKLIDRRGNIEELPLMGKEEVADLILDRLVKLRTQ